jgi:colanic acid biosynthesis glycosyl transferase WcaI
MCIAMKLILVNRYFYPDESATSRMLTSLAHALVRDGWAVHVLASRSVHNDPTARLPAREVLRGIEVHRVATSVFGREQIIGRAVDYGTFHLATLWRLLWLAARDDLCIVCTDPPLISVTASLPLWLRGSTLVNWLLDLYPEVALELGMGRSEGAMARLALRLRDNSLRKAVINVAPMRRMADYLEQRGIAVDTLVTINHWSDGAAVQPIPLDQNSLRKEWGLRDRFVVGYSGNFGRVHDFTTFLGAAERLRDHCDIVFVFIGGGQQKRAIEAAISERGLRNVLMKPLQPRERLAETLSAIDLHLISLLPTIEPFVVPSKLYGILAAGRPAIFVGDLAGEIATVLRSGDCGRSFAQGDDTGLTRAILEFAKDPSLRLRMGNNARSLFDAYYSESRGIAAWQRVLHSVARSQPITISGAAG